MRCVCSQTKKYTIIARYGQSSYWLFRYIDLKTGKKFLDFNLKVMKQSVLRSDRLRHAAEDVPIESRELHCKPEFLLLPASLQRLNTDRTQPGA
jgi:hypothetical protein